MSETFGQRLKRIRKAKKLTQRTLAEKVGVNHHLISHYERETNKPNMSTLEWLCEALDVTATELLGF
jgi:transcriptional regulator with XRE-family HTH domain